ncbi:Holliday junction resolvase RuvX [Candidatus Parcubacteria bacterium]|nr:Holliday junction resolvase RuvX [Candidatus Parcubacteria bacterium]
MSSNLTPTATMRYLGIDYGSKKAGIALSDESGTLAFPKAIMKNTPRLVTELCAIAAKEGIGAMVIGASYDSSGRENEVMADVRRFAEALDEASGLPVYFENEAFSSVEARRLQAHTEVDDSAAALILQRYLDKKNKKYD